MSKERRWATVLGLVGAAVVALLVNNVDRLGGVIPVLTFLGVAFLMVVELERE